jgi:hypothetical protein
MTGRMSGRVAGRGAVDGSAVAARRLCRALEPYGVLAIAYDGSGVSLVWVNRHLVVWCEYGPEGLYYRWFTGRRSRSRPALWVYARCAADSPDAAARQVAHTFRQLPVEQVVARVGPGSPSSGPG